MTPLEYLKSQDRFGEKFQILAWDSTKKNPDPFLVTVSSFKDYPGHYYALGVKSETLSFWPSRWHWRPFEAKDFVPFTPPTGIGKAKVYRNSEGQDFTAQQWFDGVKVEGVTPSPVLEPREGNPSGVYGQLADGGTCIPGDWIVRDLYGHLTVCPDSKFHTLFRPVSSEK